MINTDLDKAFRRWADGRSISLTLAARLMSQDIDVEALERKWKV